jgi:hypothetical protein
MRYLSCKGRSVEVFAVNCKLIHVGLIIMVWRASTFEVRDWLVDRLTCLTPVPILPAIIMRQCKFPLFPLVLLIGSMFLIGAGCGGKKNQYPEDHERYLRIDRAVESLRQAYLKKDSSDLASLMMPNDQLERLREDAQSDFDTFSAISLDFAIERIMIEGDAIDVFVHWQGLWKKNTDDPGLRHRGHTKLQWVGTQSILLRAVQGDPPFGMKARQAMTDPTQSPRKK